jgi:uncharacterized protein (DUF2062 family)
MNLRKLKERIHQLLHLDESPHGLAKAFAVGVFIAFTPFLGTHTALALFFAWLLRLNKLAALSGTFVNNPWTIALVYIGPTWAAVMVMRHAGMDVPPLHYGVLRAEFLETMEEYKLWQPVFWKTFLREFKPYIHAFLLGTTIAGVGAALAAYFMALIGIKYYRKERSKLHKKADGRPVE